MDTYKQYVIWPRGLAATHCRAADIIENRCDELTDSDPGKAMHISAAMLRAFSIELALKSLLYEEQSSKMHGHDLKKLFDAQNTEAQENIESLAKMERSISDVLSEDPRLFVEWRYIHEKFGPGAKKAVNTDELKAIANTVLEVLDNKIKQREP